MKLIVVCLGLLMVAELAKASDCVVLVHGLIRSPSAMSKLEEKLQAAGYQVVNVGYPSREHNIETLATMAIDEGLNRCELLDTSLETTLETTKVHFVTHSMGGILVRQYFEEHEPTMVGRVVMLGPPNHGSEVVDKFGGIPGFKWLNGPAGIQLGTDTNDLPKSLGPVNFETGIIAGNRSINWILSQFIPKPNDGKVSVQSTKVEGMRDFIEVAATHTFMMNNDLVIRQVMGFLKNGKFIKEPVR